MKKFLFLGLFLSIFITNKLFAADVGGTTLLSTLTPNTNVNFTGSAGDLDSDHASGSVTMLSITTNTDGEGQIRFTGAGDLEITNGVGSSTQAINNITLTNLAFISFNNDVYTTNGVFTDVDGTGGVKFLGGGTGGFLVDSQIGELGTELNTIEIGNADGTIDFNKDIYVDNTEFAINAQMKILSAVGTANLGNINIATTLNNTFTLNADVNAVSYNGNDATTTLNIASGKKLVVTTGTGVTQLNGQVNLGLSFASTDAADSSTSFDSTASTGTVTVDDATKIHFDYTDTVDLNENSYTHVFLKTDDANTLLDNSAALTTNVTDTSILLASTIGYYDNTAVSTGNKVLTLEKSLDTSTVALLNKDQETCMNLILTDTLGADARVALLKIGGLQELKQSLDSVKGFVEGDKNNMVQMVSLDISDRIQSVINYRTNALNYNYIGFSSGNNGPKSGSIWGEVFGGYASHGYMSDEEGYSAAIGGVIFGGDTIMRGSFNKDKVRINHTLGLALSFSNAVIKGDASVDQKTDVNSYQATLYNNIVAASGRGFFNENSLTIGYNEYSLFKRAEIGSYNETADATYNGTQFSARTGIGYNFTFLNKLFLSPNISIKYASLNLEDYVERGSQSYEANIDNKLFETLATNVELRIMGEMIDDSSKYDFFPQLNISWTRNLNLEGREVETTIIGGSSQPNQNVGIDLLRNVINIGFQLNIESKEASAFVLKYELQASNNYMGHLGSVRYILNF